MKRLFIAAIPLICFAFFLTPPAFAKDWYRGGTLRDASISQWKQATFENKLATCGDFAAETQEGKRRVQTYGWNELKKVAFEIVECIEMDIRSGMSPRMTVRDAARRCISRLEY